MSDNRHSRMTRYIPEVPGGPYERLLIHGPLFKPENIPDENSEPAEDLPGAAEPVREIERRRQPGWIYVASLHDYDDLLRVAVSERAAPGRTDADSIEQFAGDLRIPASETLRYCAFAPDAYAALAHVRRVLHNFDAGSLRYRCASAVAAAAVESAGVAIELRRTNFEPQRNRLRAIDEAQHVVDASEDPGGRRQANRSIRHAELNSMLEDARNCLNFASELLNDSPETRRLITGGLTESPDPADRVVEAANTNALSQDSLHRLETWVMRREALQFLRRRKHDLGFALLLATAVGAAVSVTGARLILEQSTVIERALIAGAGALVLAIVRYALFQRRYRTSIALWKAILKPTVPQ